MDDNRPKFPLLPTDEYILEVEKIEPGVKKAYQSSEDQKVMDITFKIVSFRDGNQAVDEKGNPVDERRRMFLSPAYDEELGSGLGFKSDGTASKLRQFIAYITNQNILSDLEWDWDKLIGKQIAVQIIQYEKQNGDMGNKIEHFFPPKSARRPAVAKINPDEIPIIDDSKKIDLGSDNAAEEIDVKDIPF